MRARLFDPITSQQAAEKAAVFSGSHYKRIEAALDCEPMTAKEIAGVTQLTVVQIDRRLPELERKGKTEVVKAAGVELTRNGFRVWRLAA